MGWNTKLQIQMLGYSDPVDLKMIVDTVLKKLDEDGIHSDVFADLKQAFENGEADFNVHAAYLQILLRNITQSLPDAYFEARCLGEEFRDTWVATFRNGKEIFCQGPWEYDSKAS